MRLFFSLILLGFCFVTSAQRSSMDLAGGMHYSYRTLAGEDNHGLINGRNGREHGKLSAYLGLHYTRQLTPRVRLRTGLRFSALGYRMEANNLRWGSQHDGNGGFDPTLPGDLPGDISVQTDVIFLELPLLLQHTFDTGPWTPYVEAGLLPGAYLMTRSRSEDDSRKAVTYFDETASSVNRLHPGATLAFGTDYALSDRFDLFVEYAVRYQLTPLADAPIRERLYAGGLAVGLRRIFP